jgi:arylsulfatase A
MQRSRVILLTVIVAGTLIALGGPSAARGAEPLRDNRQVPPNVVFILIDDLGWADLECYGNRYYETPQIDRLAAQGMRFTDAYAACPVCSPTRASILTGKYPATLNLTDFIPGHWRPYARLVVPDFNQLLPPREITLAEALKARGYSAGYFGKWHLGPPANDPDRHGFDVSLVSSGRHFAPRFNTRPKIEVPEGAYLADVLTDQAVNFMRAHRDGPFLLYLAHYAVHIPLEAKAELVRKFQGKPRPADRAAHPTYAAMLESVDQSVGRIVAELEALSLAEQTVVVFFSDNGGLRRRFDEKGPIVTSNAPLRAEKGTLYEGGIRVPLIVRWPGVAEPGSTCTVPVSSVDLLPTLVEIAGGAVPAEVDGVSLVPLLRGSGELDREAIYWHYPHYHHSTPAGAVRAGDYKLLEFYEDGKLELYNLKEDIGETRNLARRMPDKAEALRGLLHAWRERVGAKMPTANSDYEPKRAREWHRRPR